MEPDKTVNNSLMQALADVTHDDLDAFLSIEDPVNTSFSLPLTDSDTPSKENRENVMKFNREPFPSQMTFNCDNNANLNVTGLTNISNVDSNLTSLHLQSNLNTSSIIFHSQEIEAINLNDSTVSTRNMPEISLMEFSEIKSEKFDLSSNPIDMDTLDDDFPNLSGIDFDEMEKLEHMRNSGVKISNSNRVKPSCRNFLTEKDNNLSSSIATVKEERLDSLCQSGSEDTLAGVLNEYASELPNLDVDFELLDEIERTHTSRQTGVTMVSLSLLFYLL